MPVSMTGFGRFETNDDAWTHVWEIKSVNGRFLDVKWRMPGYLRSLENGWEKVLRAHASRGRVDVSLNLEVLDARILGVTFNETMAQAMFDQMEKLAVSRGGTFEPDYNRVLSMSALWRDCGTEPDPGLADSLTKGLEAALKEWVSSRATEGDALVADLTERMQNLRDLTEKVKQRIPDILEAKKAALRQRIVDMLESANAEFSEDRMLQEVAYLTDKLDVSEELTRLDAHLERLGEVMTEKADVGKKLDFLVQETFREINTCGNKAQDTEVSQLVVDFKAELERCREQVQNIE
ncbi:MULTISPECIES: YicC/YloC family endoribonuclease [unclassified Pseudodesulfovibrio]|uniref:YicC/YloC family endoribonuclease n=1 Tax=unclassified Pseudodesulfovibrio TaxID=2661612 RepID=UPI000FEB830E|nr:MULTISPECIES: YicC/YloC family endoribonuclease [unclassified Pseudodesulfovibrio]MCJ2162988.1 YicC family protein [Pseudodesulfovibrio sp. S3-i]RWU06985.1 YicC family protein [Pseudodesulfovibrio sp. S3]